MPVRIITAEKLATYMHFSGDIDAWARTHSSRSGIEDDDWYLIDDLRQRLSIAATGTASESFRSSLEADLASSAPDSAVRDELRRLAGTPGS